MGILSALTTGFWGAVSDRLGRTTVMSLSIMGLVSRLVVILNRPSTSKLKNLVHSDVVLIITATYPDKIPGGYRFILLGPIIDGLLGGFSTIMATNNAYLSDVTPDGSRAHYFGRVQGVMMFGFSLGPILGSAVIRATGDMSVE
jgi:MFS family permease